MLDTTHCLEYLGLVLDMNQAQVFIPPEKILPQVKTLQARYLLSVHFCMRVLCLSMVASSKAKLYIQFDLRLLQLGILAVWNKLNYSLNHPMSPRARISLVCLPKMVSSFHPN